MSIHAECLLQTLIGRAGQTQKNPFLKRGKGAECSKTSCRSSLTRKQQAGPSPLV
jgi:hypothetical protein